jgi:hypothetical protein
VFGVRAAAGRGRTRPAGLGPHEGHAVEFAPTLLVQHAALTSERLAQFRSGEPLPPERTAGVGLAGLLKRDGPQLSRRGWRVADRTRPVSLTRAGFAAGNRPHCPRGSVARRNRARAGQRGTRSGSTVMRRSSKGSAAGSVDGGHVRLIMRRWWHWAPSRRFRVQVSRWPLTAGPTDRHRAAV